MISNIFFYGKIKEAINSEIYEEEFVQFFLNLKLFEVKEFDERKVKKCLEEYYGKENIKNNAVTHLCEKYFFYNGEQYNHKLNEDERNLYNKIREFEKMLRKLKIVDRNSLYNLLEKEINDKAISFEEKLKKVIIFYYFNKDDITILLYRYYKILKEYYNIYRMIDYKLLNIPELFNSLEISELELTDEQMGFLICNNVFTFKNLKIFDIDAIICIFSNDINEFMSGLNKFAISKEKIFDNLNEKFNSTMKEDWIKILEARFDYRKQNRKTLAEIGKELNITRERVRQIQNKALDKLLKSAYKLDFIFNCFYTDINQEKRNFITVEELIKYLNNENLARYLIIILNSGKFSLYFSEEYEIIFNSKENSLNEIIKEEKENLGSIIPVSNISNFNKVQKKIIEKEYRLYKEKILVHKSCNISSIYINEIKENFIDGYNISSKEDYNKLLKIIKDKYGDIEMSSMHSIQAMIDRNDFVQIDRGTYKAREYCPDITEELTNKIIDFIIKNSPIIAYSHIFENYKKQLETLGINNRFYLKGIIDKKLPEDFITGRDFINTKFKLNITTSEMVHKIFESFEGEFTIEDIKEKLPGLKNYNYNNYVNIEEENGLIRISSGNYVYIEKLNISEDTKKELKNYIDNIFKSLNSNIITAKKIYISLIIYNKELLNKLHITSKFGDYELFSIIKYLFKDHYYFSRPLISTEENFSATTYSLIKEYAEKLDKFNYNDLKNYTSRMNLGGLTSYINFIEDLSDEYVQVSVDGMIRKSKFKITEEELKKIQNLLDLILQNNEFRTDNFDGYFMLPKLERPWNKYMLIGIIRSYFPNEYEIKNTNKYYDSTDFIVRRI